MNKLELSEALMGQDTYKFTKVLKDEIAKNDKQAIKTCCETIATILKEAKVPMQMLMAMRVYKSRMKLAKEVIEMQQQDFIREFATTVLPCMESIALFKKEDKQEGRGKYLFSEEPNKQQAQIGNSIFRLVMDCIQVWSHWYPVDPQTKQKSPFVRLFESLQRVGVEFPKLSYYKQEDLQKKNVSQSEILTVQRSNTIDTQERPTSMINQPQRANTTDLSNQLQPPKQSAPSKPSLNPAKMKERVSQFLKLVQGEMELVGDILTSEEGAEELEMLDECSQNMTKYQNQAEELLLELMEMEFEGSDKMTEDLVMKQDFLSEFVADFNDWRKTKKITYIGFKKKYYKVCSPTPDPNAQFGTPNPDMMPEPPTKKSQPSQEKLVKNSDTNKQQSQKQLQPPQEDEKKVQQLLQPQKNDPPSRNDQLNSEKADENIKSQPQQKEVSQQQAKNLRDKEDIQIKQSSDESKQKLPDQNSQKNQRTATNSSQEQPPIRQKTLYEHAKQNQDWTEPSSDLEEGQKLNQNTSQLQGASMSRRPISFGQSMRGRATSQAPRTETQKKFEQYKDKEDTEDEKKPIPNDSMTKHNKSPQGFRLSQRGSSVQANGSERKDQERSQQPVNTNNNDRPRVSITQQNQQINTYLSPDPKIQSISKEQLDVSRVVDEKELKFTVQEYDKKINKLESEIEKLRDKNQRLELQIDTKQKELNILGSTTATTEQKIRPVVEENIILKKEVKQLQDYYSKQLELLNDKLVQRNQLLNQLQQQVKEDNNLPTVINEDFAKTQIPTPGEQLKLRNHSEKLLLLEKQINEIQQTSQPRNSDSLDFDVCTYDKCSKPRILGRATDHKSHMEYVIAIEKLRTDLRKRKSQFGNVSGMLDQMERLISNQIKKINQALEQWKHRQIESLRQKIQSYEHVGRLCETIMNLSSRRQLEEQLNNLPLIHQTKKYEDLLRECSDSSDKVISKLMNIRIKDLLQERIVINDNEQIYQWDKSVPSADVKIIGQMVKMVSIFQKTDFNTVIIKEPLSLNRTFQIKIEVNWDSQCSQSQFYGYNYFYQYYAGFQLFDLNKRKKLSGPEPHIFVDKKLDTYVISQHDYLSSQDDKVINPDFPKPFFHPTDVLNIVFDGPTQTFMIENMSQNDKKWILYTDFENDANLCFGVSLFAGWSYEIL